MDFLVQLTKVIDTFLQSSFNPSPIFTQVTIPALVEGDSMALMVMPSNDYDHYMDGSYRQNFHFQIMARSENQLASYNAIVALSAFVDSLQEGDIVSADGTFEFEGATIVTDTNGPFKDDHGYTFLTQMSAALFVSPEPITG